MLSICLFGMANIASAEAFKFLSDPKYVGEAHIGYGSTSKVNGFNTLQGRFVFGTIQGFRLNQYFQCGAGLDVLLFTNYYKGQSMRAGMTLYGDFRGMYPLENEITPFVDFAIGGYIGFNKHGGSAFYCELGPGVKYKNWALSLGMDAIGTGSGCATFFVKTGYWF